MPLYQHLPGSGTFLSAKACWEIWCIMPKPFLFLTLCHPTYWDETPTVFKSALSHFQLCYTADLPLFLLFWDLHLIKWESNEWSSVSLPIWCHIPSVPSVPVFIWSQNKRTASCAFCQYGTGHHSLMLLMWFTLLWWEYSCFWELL